MSAPSLDVLAILADLQQQLTDLTAVVQTQQRTLQHLFGEPAAGTASVAASTLRADLR